MSLGPLTHEPGSEPADTSLDSTFQPEISLDRESAIPLYEQIARPIEAAILSGSLPPGAMLEDEISLAKRLDVARPTARRALQELAHKGMVTRRRGIGTRVTPPHVRRPMKLSSLNEDLIQAGFTPSTRVLSYEVREANPDEAKRFDIEPGTGILSVSRLRMADDHPLAILTNLLPIDVAPSWQELGEHGLYHCLHTRGIDITSASQEIGAREATADEARLLDEQPGSPLLTMQRIGHTADGRTVEIGTHVYRPSLYSFRFTLFTH